MNGHDLAVVLAATLPSLIGVFSLRRVGQIHKRVNTAMNGQRDELMRGQAELLRRLEALEDEVATAQSAIVATIAAGPPKRTGWHAPFRR